MLDNPMSMVLPEADQTGRIPIGPAATVLDGFFLSHALQAARVTNGPAFLHVHIPCPTEWGFDPSRTFEVGQLALTIRSGAWHLGQVRRGTWSHQEPHGERLPVARYLETNNGSTT